MVRGCANGALSAGTLGLLGCVCSAAGFQFQGESRVMTNIYVGNLPWNSTEEDVRAMFEQYGSVSSVKLVSDRETGKPRGFGFVEMEDEGAQAAIEALDGSDVGGRSIKVNVAKPRNDRRPR
jgi:RNA recognition motif-containing protein